MGAEAVTITRGELAKSSELVVPWVMFSDDLANGQLLHLAPEWRAVSLPAYLIYPYAVSTWRTAALRGSHARADADAGRGQRPVSRIPE